MVSALGVVINHQEKYICHLFPFLSHLGLMIRACFACVLYLALTGYLHAGQLTPADCTVDYEENEGSMGLKVAMATTKPKSLPEGYKDQALSPQQTSALTTFRFDSTKTGSGPIVIALHTRRSGDTFLSFDPAIGGGAQWLNEDLVFIQIWWGRIAASEMVFDTSNRKFVYRKLANYSFGINPECANVKD